MSSRILVLNGSHSELPYILELRSRGFYVITAGTDTAAIGNKFADEHICVDYSNVDLIKEQILKKKVDLLFPSCNDFSMFTCSSLKNEVENAWAFDSVELTHKIHLKDIFKKVAERFELPVAKGLSFNKSEEAIQYIYRNIKKPNEFIVKPNDLSGGKGIQRLDNFNFKSQIEFAFKLSRTKNIVIEEFFQGSNHGLCAIVVDGQVKFSFLDREYFSETNPYKVLGTYTDTTISEEVVELIGKQLDQIVRKFEISNGYVHFQLKIDVEQSNIVFLEMCRRPPGDLHSVFVQLSTGQPIISWIVDSFVNEQNLQNIKTSPSKSNNILRHTDNKEKIAFDHRILNKISDTKFNMVDFITFYSF
jgi:biotin carboxylase